MVSKEEPSLKIVRIKKQSSLKTNLRKVEKKEMYCLNTCFYCSNDTEEKQVHFNR